MESRDTETLPNLPQGAGLQTDDDVTSLRVVGRDVEYSLSPHKVSFTLGADPSCDVVVNDSHVSGVHCLLTRRGGRLRVTDQHSHNGTYFMSRREDRFDIGPGDVFSAAGTPFLAMTKNMREAREVVAEIASTDQNEPRRFLDEILSASMRGPHVVIVGEQGSDQERLALSLHYASRWRAKMIEIGSIPSDRRMQKKLLDEASNGAICMSLKAPGDPLDEAFLSMLLSTDYRVRLFVLAPMMSTANNALGFLVVARMLQILIPPIRERAGQVPSILDRNLYARGSPLRFADLQPPNQNALLRYTWPANFVELRDVAKRLVALHEHGSVKRAAVALGMARSTLQYWFKSMALELPLTAPGTRGVPLNSSRQR
jgi:FHA domain